MDKGKAGSNFELLLDRVFGGGVEDRLGVLGDPIGIGDRLTVGGVA